MATVSKDGIPNKVFMLAVKSRLDVFVEQFEVCLVDGIFPAVWKN